MNFAHRRFVVVRGVAFLGAVAFLCADPIWRVGQAFSPSGLLLLISVFAVFQFFSFLQHAIAGVQIDHVKVALDEPGAEAVYGGDVRSMDQDHLFLQMFIVRTFCT